MTKNSFLLIVIIATYIQGCAQQSIKDKEIQIAAAVKAAIEEEREGATVYGYDSKGQLVLLREGANNMICLSDDPAREGFQVVCYHKDLEQFMARGRQLRAEGKTANEVFNIREEEAKAGKLKMPEQPTTLHILEGAVGRYDMERDSILDAHYRYVVYIPWATAESTGLPLKPMVPGGPWIMDPGTHRAHIMITPPAD